jgi:hypothetical protein
MPLIIIAFSGGGGSWDIFSDPEIEHLLHGELRSGARILDQNTWHGTASASSAQFQPNPPGIFLNVRAESIVVPMEFGGVILIPELEREVFETAAFLDHAHIPRLLLVAKRFHTW